MTLSFSLNNNSNNNSTSTRLDEHEQKLILFFVENCIAETNLLLLRRTINDTHAFYSAYLSLLKKGVLEERLEENNIVVVITTRFIKLYLGLIYKKSVKLLLFLTRLATKLKMDKIPVHRRVLKYNPMMDSILTEAEQKTFYNALDELRERGFLKLELELELEKKGKGKGKRKRRTRYCYYFYLSNVPELVKEFVRASPNSRKKISHSSIQT